MKTNILYKQTQRQGKACIVDITVVTYYDKFRETQQCLQSKYSYTLKPMCQTYKKYQFWFLLGFICVYKCSTNIVYISLNSLEWYCKNISIFLVILACISCLYCFPGSSVLTIYASLRICWEIKGPLDQLNSSTTGHSLIRLND